MFTLHCTKKLLDRIHPEVVAPRTPTTRLGNWSATALFWKPQMALLVNERTLLPVVMPLAPAATLAKRFPAALKDVLQALDLPADFIQAEMDGMGEVVYAKTANRSLIGVLNEFSFLGEAFRDRGTLVDRLPPIAEVGKRAMWATIQRCRHARFGCTRVGGWWWASLSYSAKACSTIWQWITSPVS